MDGENLVYHLVACPVDRQRYTGPLVQGDYSFLKRGAILGKAFFAREPVYFSFIDRLEELCRSLDLLSLGYHVSVSFHAMIDELVADRLYKDIVQVLEELGVEVPAYLKKSKQAFFYKDLLKGKISYSVENADLGVRSLLIGFKGKRDTLIDELEELDSKERDLMV